MGITLAVMRLYGKLFAVIRQLHCGYTATLLRLLAALPVVLTRIFTELGADLHLKKSVKSVKSVRDLATCGAA